MISIIDYGLGNVKAFSNIFKMLNIEHEITANFDAIENSSKLILPGVGSFDWAMHKLTSSGLKELLDKLVIQKLTNPIPIPSLTNNFKSLFVLNVLKYIKISKFINRVVNSDFKLKISPFNINNSITSDGYTNSK